MADGKTDITLAIHVRNMHVVLTPSSQA